MDIHKQLNNRNLTIGLWNCNSMKTHKKEIIDTMKWSKTHIFCINETKLKPSIKMELENYEIIGKDRNSKGGGVATLVHNTLEFERIKTLDHFGLELVAIKLLNNKFIHIINIYILPRKTADENFLDEEFLLEVDKLMPYIICGDLNSKSKKSTKMAFY